MNKELSWHHNKNTIVNGQKRSHDRLTSALRLKVSITLCIKVINVANVSDLKTH